MSDLVYLYGFIDGDAPPPSSEGGVGGRAVRHLDLGPVTAVVSSVPEEDFGEAAVEARLSDLDWVGEVGAGHERVVTWYVDHGGILPARLLTLHSSEEALREGLEERLPAVAEELSALRGLREWDLKVTYDRATLSERLGEVSDEVARLDRELDAAPPGRRYLLERKRSGLVEAEAARAARRLSDELLGVAAASARETLRLPLPRGAGASPVALRAALLVEVAREEELARTVAAELERLEPLGLRAELTGPWAPYRFVAGGGEGGSDGA